MTRLAHGRRLQMREHVHARRIEITEPRHALLALPLHEVERGGQELLVHRFHPLPGERTGVFDCLLADLAKHRIDRRIVLVGRFALDDAARPELLPEIRVFRVVGVFGLFLGVQVIQIAEELVEAVHRRQVLVAIAQVVLAELAGGVSEALEDLRDRGILRLEAQRGAGHADLGEAGADRLLAGNEGGATGGAALLAVEIGEHRAVLRDAVDVRRPVSHEAVVVAADIEPADVVRHDEKNVRLAGLRHLNAPLLSLARCYLHQQAACVGDVHGVADLRTLEVSTARLVLTVTPGTCSRSCPDGHCGHRCSLHISSADEYSQTEKGRGEGDVQLREP